MNCVRIEMKLKKNIGEELMQVQRDASELFVFGGWKQSNKTIRR